VKENIINRVIQVEGGYSNNPDDSGGETMYGITKRVARRYGYTGKMRNLPKSLAFEIYEAKYWSPLHLDNIMQESPMIAEELMDTAINMGIRRAGRFLQRALNALNNKGTIYPDCTVDGIIGRKTISAFQTYMGRRGKDGVVVMHRMLNSLQGAYYLKLAERRQKDETFVYGWFKNRVV